jgi:hypothetical protein
MSERPPRWRGKRIGVSVRLRDIGRLAEGLQAPHVADMLDLADEGGERIGHAVVVPDARGRRAVIAQIQWDEHKATEAQAMQALERLLTATAEDD